MGDRLGIPSVLDLYFFLFFLLVFVSLEFFRAKYNDFLLIQFRFKLKFFLEKDNKMSISNMKTNGYNYLNNSFSNGTSVLGNLISGSAKSNGTNGNNTNGANNNSNSNNNSSPNLDLKQQVTETCEGFEVSSHLLLLIIIIISFRDILYFIFLLFF